MTIEIIVSEETSGIKTYQEAIRMTGGKMVEKGTIQPEYIDACIEREIDFPTGLLLASGEGIAMPHGNSDLVNESSISVLRLNTPVEFGRMEDNSQKVACSLVFNLALGSGGQHINVLRKIIGLFQDEEFVETCKTAEIIDVKKYIADKLVD